jgi:hypothetical protein
MGLLYLLWRYIDEGFGLFIVFALYLLSRRSFYFR